MAESGARNDLTGRADWKAAAVAVAVAEGFGTAQTSPLPVLSPRAIISSRDSRSPAADGSRSPTGKVTLAEPSPPMSAVGAGSPSVAVTLGMPASAGAPSSENPSRQRFTLGVAFPVCSDCATP